MSDLLSTDLPPDIEALAGDFVAHAEATRWAELEDMYTPDAIIWHSYNATEMTPMANVQALKALFAYAIDRFSYEQIRRHVTKDGYVQQHRLCAIAKDGAQFYSEACFIVTVVDGRITRLDEYLDSTAGQAMEAAVAAASSVA